MINNNTISKEMQQYLENARPIVVETCKKIEDPEENKVAESLCLCMIAELNDADYNVNSKQYPLKIDVTYEINKPTYRLTFTNLKSVSLRKIYRIYNSPKVVSIVTTPTNIGLSVILTVSSKSSPFCKPSDKYVALDLEEKDYRSVLESRLDLIPETIKPYFRQIVFRTINMSRCMQEPNWLSHSINNLIIRAAPVPFTNILFYSTLMKELNLPNFNMVLEFCKDGKEDAISLQNYMRADFYLGSVENLTQQISEKADNKTVVTQSDSQPEKIRSSNTARDLSIKKSSIHKQQTTTSKSLFKKAINYFLSDQ